MRVPTEIHDGREVWEMSSVFVICQRLSKRSRPDFGTLGLQCISFCYVLFRHVPRKLARCFAGKAALVTAKWLFSSVPQLVAFQIGALRARKVALVTLERSFS